MSTAVPSSAPRCLPFGPEAVADAARAILDGQCVAVPTETVYGLAADATDAGAVAGIYAAKGRPSFNPLIVHLPDRAAGEALAVFDEPARQLAEAFWPGPLTLVLPLRAGAGIASLVTAGLSSIAVRVPAHRAMQALLAVTGKPLAAPSANASGGISPTRAAHVVASLGARIPLVIDDGPTECGLESTILACTDGSVRLLRPGPIAAERVAAITGTMPGAAGEGIEAPGQLASHYAPGKPVRLDVREPGADEWLIGFGAIRGNDSLSATGDLVEAAARLFDCLHRADAAPRPRIAVAPVPRHGLGVAINDRLARAAV